MSAAAEDSPVAEPEVVLGLLAAPGAPAQLAGVLAEDLRAELTARLPGVRWRVEQVEEALVPPPADDAQIVAAARQVLLRCGWDLGLVLTDLPLRISRRPVVAHASPVHGVAVLCVPALGAVGLRRRARALAVQLVDELLGEGSGSQSSGPARAQRLTRRLRELADDADPDAAPLRFTARVLTGNLRLLVGMVRANRPWRLAARLSRALVAAVAAGVFALVTSDIWRIADTLGALRLTALALGSVLAITATLIVGGGLWERAASPRAREQAALFNLATTATVLLGVLALYGALFLIALPAGLLLVVPELFSDGLGHPVGLAEYAQLAALTSSLATVGGALGAGLETDEAVRDAAYTHRAGDDGSG